MVKPHCSNFRILTALFWISELNHLSWLMRLWHLSSSVNSSNAQAQPSNGATRLIFGQILHLFLYLCANSEGSGETAQMRSLTWAFAVRLRDKYHNLMSWLIWMFTVAYQFPLSEINIAWCLAGRNRYGSYCVLYELVNTVCFCMFIPSVQRKFTCFKKTVVK